MGMVSYAQNNEDVLLHRVFAAVHYAFYVDIGAYHPVTDSVTKSFYDRGWDGINIEPGDIFDELAAGRPRDINLRMAVTDHAGTAGFAQHPGWYAGLSHVQAEPPPPSEATARLPAIENRSVPCDTLANILDRYAPGRPIAFLKIDAEGAEESIVRSTNWRAIRPTVIVIEATKPRSTVLDNAHWEPVLLEGGYLRAYFDGINCFYVPEERADLLRNFELPVNVLDGAERHDPRLAAAHAQVAAAEAEARQSAAELAASGAEQAALRDLHAAAQRTLREAEDHLEAAGQQAEASAQQAEASAHQLAELRDRLAAADARSALLVGERDALLALRDQAERLRRLWRELRWPDGPGALRLVLPLARLLRRVARTKVPLEDSAPLTLAYAAAPASASAAPTLAAPISSMAELQAELGRFGKLLEDTLLTMALEGTPASLPDHFQVLGVSRPGGDPAPEVAPRG